MELTLISLAVLVALLFVSIVFLHLLGDEVLHWGTILMRLWTNYNAWSFHFEERRIKLLHHLDSMSIVRKLYRTSFGDRMDESRAHDPEALAMAERIKTIEIFESDHTGVTNL